MRATVQFEEGIMSLGTFRLFARPTFLSGFGRLLGTYAHRSYYNYSRSAAEADALALSSDWQEAVGDFLVVVDRVKRKAEEARSRQSPGA